MPRHVRFPEGRGDPRAPLVESDALVVVDRIAMREFDTSMVYMGILCETYGRCCSHLTGEARGEAMGQGGGDSLWGGGTGGMWGGATEILAGRETRQFYKENYGAKIYPAPRPVMQDKVSPRPDENKNAKNLYPVGAGPAPPLATLVMSGHFPHGLERQAWERQECGVLMAASRSERRQNRGDWCTGGRSGQQSDQTGGGGCRWCIGA
ncbi:hypothetical protein Sjap_005763 [Stephania japonica]|uniref:Uncharacterized protein n=1 Tax=Stephania japonica TaxID=461633 RepID=A0AAP0K760_9MAGN